MASTVASVSCAGATALTVSLRGRMPSPADRTSSHDMTEPPAEPHRSDRPGRTDEIRSPQSGVLGPDNQPLFETATTVSTRDEGGKTTVTVHERVEKIFDPAAAGPLSGMERGLHMVLDNLREYLRKL